MNLDQFRQRFLPGVELTDEQEEAVELFLEGHSAILWGNGRAGGKSLIRDAIRAYLEWEELWEQRGRKPHDIVGDEPQYVDDASFALAYAHWINIGMPMDRDDVLREIHMRWITLEGDRRPIRYVQVSMDVIRRELERMDRLRRTRIYDPDEVFRRGPRL